MGVGLSGNEPSTRFVASSSLNARGRLHAMSNCPAALHQVKTAKGRDWIVGDEAFEFKYVMDIDNEGLALPAAHVPPVVLTGNEDMSVFATCSAQGPQLHEVRVWSMETVGLLRQRLRHALNCTQVRIVFGENELGCDQTTLDEMGVVQASQLDVIPTPCDNVGFYELSAREKLELNSQLASLRQLVQSLRSNSSAWTAVRNDRLSAAQNALDLACSTMHADVATMVQSHAKLWGRQMASTSGENMGAWFESGSSALSTSSASDRPSRTPTADTALLRAGSEDRLPAACRLVLCFGFARWFVLAGVTLDRDHHDVPIFMRSVQAVLSSLLQGQLGILHRQQAIGRARMYGSAPSLCSGFCITRP